MLCMCKCIKCKSIDSKKEDTCFLIEEGKKK